MNDLTRLDRVKEVIRSSECEAFLVENTINLYYLTGINLSAGQMVIKTEGDSVLLVDSRYFELCKNKASVPVLLSEKNTLDKVLNGVKKVAFDSETITYQNFLNLKMQLKDQTLVPLKNPIQKIRAIKEPQEIILLREAAFLGEEGFQYAKSLLKDEISELEVALELEIFWKRKGAQGLAFEPIIAFGENSAMPHHRASDKRLKKGMTVLIDIGVKWKGYHSDMTRTFFWGDPPQVMHDIYDIVQEAQKRALTLCKPNTLIGDLDSTARDYIALSGYGQNFLHSLGHGVGLEIHEWPLIRKTEPYQSLPLQPGFVITIEPGIYLQGIGGVRIEDTVAITSTGCEILTVPSPLFQ